jgi:hypothetical protein
VLRHDHECLSTGGAKESSASQDHHNSNRPHYK